MKTSRVCTGMLSSENDDFTCTTVPRLVELFLSLQTSLSLTKNMNIKVVIELYYIFSKVSKFRYW